MVKNNPINKYEVGDAIDSLNHVLVYYNGGIRHSNGISKSSDGYEFGSKYESKEFINRYYYQFYNHKMPVQKEDPTDFFNPNIKDGYWNKDARLTQYRNPSKSKPKVGDILVIKGNILDLNGHVAIITKVVGNEVEIIQQNPGPNTASRETYELTKTENGLYKLRQKQLLGWLRK